MSSSELSNALNPDVIAKPRRRHAQPAVPLTAPPTPALAPQQPAPHRSELELAIPPPSVEVGTIAPQVISQQPARNGNPIFELYQVIATAGEAAAAERKRRIAWEREQEAKSLQRQREMERQILDMREEIHMLKAYIRLHPHIPAPGVIQDPSIFNAIPSTAHIEPASPALEPSPHTPLSPISPVPAHPAVPQTLFVEGPSSHPLNTQQHHVPSPLYDAYSPALHVISPPASTSSTPQFSPASVPQNAVRADSTEQLAPPTPQSTGITPVSSSPLPEVVPPRKRPRLVAEDESDYQSDTDDDADDPSVERGGPRRNGHDGRCLTIHHAMRIHVRKMMKLKHDDDLPESHFEGAPLLADQPVRFVWNKTTKQSAHNAAMKRRIVSDLKANRTRYKHVPDKEFNKKNLESVFDQVFTTLRQRHKAQQDATAASRLQRRENQKALKARRLQRKKAKLSNRVDARKRIDAFAQPVFETALHQDCMSSEESDGEYVEDGEKVQVFRTRGPSWRSARLVRYYAILDDQDRLEKSMKPKRGIGRRIRREGPPKDGLFLPPKGVARWMVSRRWLQETEAMRPDLVDALRDLVVDDAEQETEVTRVMLGAEESEDEATQGALAPEAYAHISDTSYSLHNALQPV
ncbi:hypothetical protein GY45DRAFT_1327227 [Cubamyces sp. BRFM 1775]|nr:hypothetical protein GY45DRAFT_1327227 [Cubamyces sp. BRFM 1775]